MKGPDGLQVDGFHPLKPGLARSIVAMLLITSVVPLTVLAGFFLFFGTGQQRTARELVHRETAERMAIAVSAKLEMAFDAIDRLWDTLHYEGLETARLEKTAGELMDRNPSYDSVTFTDASGAEKVKLSRYYTYTAPEFGSLADSPEFRDAMGGVMQIGQITPSPFNKFPVIYVTKRLVRQDGSAVGACRIGINVSSFWNVVTAEGVRTGSRYAYIVDGTGTVIASADVAFVLGKKAMRGAPSVEALLAGRSGVFTYVGLNGREDIGAAVPISLTHWGVIVEEPVAIAYGGTAVYSVVFFLLLIVSSLVIAFVGWRFSMRNIVDPIRLLEAKARSVAAGDLSVVFPDATGGEIGSLGTTFNRMVSELREFTENLDGLVKRRTAELDDSLRKLESANGQIVESIQYARTIQKAILPPESAIAEHLADHFVIWNPKDLIGGDIYWFAGGEAGFLAAVIDCTGHSVPGAIMTMIAGSALNRVVSELGPGDPAAILARMDRIVRQTLSQHREETESNDGLDIGLCHVRADGSVRFAGARLSLYVLTPGETREIRGSRRSIGYKSMRPEADFSNREVAAEPGLCFYMATDGMRDQVGGERSLPFGKTRLLRTLGSVRDRPMAEQREVLLSSFEQYRRDEVQRDDVTVFGFRLDGNGVKR